MNNQSYRDYLLVEKAIAFIEGQHAAQPSLARVAEAVGLSEFHFQKLFSRWVGISPKRFLQFLTKEHAKKLLAESRNVLDASLDAGLSGPGRLHDLLVQCEAVTPGEYKKMGAGLTIRYGVVDSLFGRCLIATTLRGICALMFMGRKSDDERLRELAAQWPRATLVHDARAIDALARRIFNFEPPTASAPLHLFVKGTNFQIKVWEALMAIPFGTVVAYQDIAAAVGHPGATRAVGTAIGSNPIPYIIPCHRVIRKMGAFGNYGSGPARKKAMIGWESAKREVHGL